METDVIFSGCCLEQGSIRAGSAMVTLDLSAHYLCEPLLTGCIIDYENILASAKFINKFIIVL